MTYRYSLTVPSVAGWARPEVVTSTHLVVPPTVATPIDGDCSVPRKSGSVQSCFHSGNGSVLTGVEPLKVMLCQPSAVMASHCRPRLAKAAVTNWFEGTPLTVADGW